MILGSPPGPFLVLDHESDPGLFNGITITPVLYALALIFAEPILGIEGLQ